MARFGFFWFRPMYQIAPLGDLVIVISGLAATAARSSGDSLRAMSMSPFSSSSRWVAGSAMWRVTMRLNLGAPSQ